MGVLDKLQSADLNVFPYRCVVMRNRNASCMRCAAACTSGAISVTADELTVDPDLCVGCGTCATVCPTCALEARHPNDATFAESALSALGVNDDAAVVVCDRMWEANEGLIDPAKAARVTCLGRVEESVIVELAAAGAKSVSLVHGDCANCPRNVGVETYTLVCETANLLLETWGSPVRAELKAKLPTSVRAAAPAPAAAPALGYDPSRRSAFAQAGQLGAEAVAAGMREGDGEDAEPQKKTVAKYLKVMNDGTLPHFVPDRRERLLDGLAQLGEPADVALDTRLWGRVVIEPSTCKTCFMCATFCPTGAISRFAESKELIGVEHTPADCVKCRCCEDVCPTGALTLHEDVMAREVVAGNVVERFYLPPITDGRGGPHSMYGALKKFVRCDQFYER
jgi:Fe-S-cluster-containing hydrogenase component 2